jgi:hypothetical protein
LSDRGIFDLSPDVADSEEPCPDPPLPFPPLPFPPLPGPDEVF